MVLFKRGGIIKVHLKECKDLQDGKFGSMEE